MRTTVRDWQRDWIRDNGQTDDFEVVTAGRKSIPAALKISRTVSWTRMCFIGDGLLTHRLRSGLGPIGWLYRE